MHILAAPPESDRKWSESWCLFVSRFNYQARLRPECCHKCIKLWTASLVTCHGSHGKWVFAKKNSKAVRHASTPALPTVSVSKSLPHHWSFYETSCLADNIGTPGSFMFFRTTSTWNEWVFWRCSDLQLVSMQDIEVPALQEAAHPFRQDRFLLDIAICKKTGSCILSILAIFLREVTLTAHGRSGWQCFALTTRRIPV